MVVEVRVPLREVRPACRGTSTNSSHPCPIYSTRAVVSVYIVLVALVPALTGDYY
jgi:hypothetical protein